MGPKHFHNITTLFYSKKEHDKVNRSLKRRFDNAPAVEKDRTLLIKRYSNASDDTTFVYEA